MNITLRTVRPDEFLKMHLLNTRWMGISLNDQADAILALQFRVLVENFHDSCFVAELDSRIVGLVLGFVSQADGADCYLHALAVDPSVRRKGMGATLVKTFCDNMARRGCKRVSLVTWPENPGSRAFYDRTGFHAKVVGEPVTIKGIVASRDYYGPGRHMVLYTKEISKRQR